MNMKWHFPLILDGKESILDLSEEELEAKLKFGDDIIRRYLNGEFVNYTVEDTKKYLEQGKKVYEAQQKRLGKKSYW